MPQNKITGSVRGGILGLAVGDALGVPVEFKNRETLKKNPVTGMIGYGTYNQPPGTWSDDSSLTFSLMDALCDGFDIETIIQKFISWLFHGQWTAHGKVFDVGITTSQALQKLKNGISPNFDESNDEYSNGNGSLMRILPLVFFTQHTTEKERFDMTKAVSSITHSHIRSILACFYYVEFARNVCEGHSKLEAYQTANTILKNKINELGVNKIEGKHFGRILSGNIHELAEGEISSGNYVIHSLEASLWCVLTSDSYPEAVVKAVNLGGDTDTTAAISGGLAGIIFGESDIPEEWIQKLARINDIEELIKRFENKTGAV